MEERPDVDLRGEQPCVDMLLREAGQLEAPINVFAVADFLGLTVVPVGQSLYDAEHFTPDEIARVNRCFEGVYVHSERTCAIGLKTDAKLTRLRFTAAEEIAHYLCSQALPATEFRVALRFRNDDATEHRAHEMWVRGIAAMVLMPATMTRSKWALLMDTPGMTSRQRTSALADHFAVGIRGARLRLKELHLTA